MKILEISRSISTQEAKDMSLFDPIKRYEPTGDEYLDFKLDDGGEYGFHRFKTGNFRLYSANKSYTLEVNETINNYLSELGADYKVI